MAIIRGDCPNMGTLRGKCCKIYAVSDIHTIFEDFSKFIYGLKL
jgi:hypothetical protein